MKQLKNKIAIDGHFFEIMLPKIVKFVDVPYISYQLPILKVIFQHILDFSEDMIVVLPKMICCNPRNTLLQKSTFLRFE